jgi:para-aminobenzoate synthetase component 2
MILIIDSYDSFTFNMVDAFRKLGAAVSVFQNDEITLRDIEKMKPSGLVIAPGPGRPEQAGIIISVIKNFWSRIPILGVCLGHQAIAVAFGGRVVTAARLMHGKTSEIYHDGQGIFRDLPMPFAATRYHSLVVDINSPDPELKITAETREGVIMGLQYSTYPVFGVQFHPESILTICGNQIFKNFLGICRLKKSKAHPKTKGVVHG